MTIVACPKCADLVALPDRASRRATVRCPLCQAQFLLTEVLDKLPPALLVVDDPEAARKKALLEAAIERARQAKEAAAPANTEQLTPGQQAEVDAIEARRKAAGQEETTP